MTDSPHTDDDEARIRAIARYEAIDAATPAFLLALAASVLSVIVGVILIAQWIFA